MDGRGPTQVLSPADGHEGELALLYEGGVPIIRKKEPHEGMIQFVGSEG